MMVFICFYIVFYVFVDMVEQQFMVNKEVNILFFIMFSLICFLDVGFNIFRWFKMNCVVDIFVIYVYVKGNCCY